MKKSLAAAFLATAATAATVVFATPAHAHTLCDNRDGGEIGYWTSPTGPGVGADTDETNGLYVCADTGLTGPDYQVVVIRLNDPEVCLFYPSVDCI